MLPENWQDREAYLILLTELFMKPILPHWEKESRDWRRALGIDYDDAVQGLQNAGILEEATIAERLWLAFTVYQLKPMLKERSLKVSGRKQELIQRLIDADPNGMQNAVADMVALRWSQQGQAIGQAYLAQVDTERAEVATNMMTALSQRDFEKACRIAHIYNRKQVFPQVVSGWAFAITEEGSQMEKLTVEDYDATNTDIPMLNCIYSVRPGPLKALSDEELEILRVHTAMSIICPWPDNKSIEKVLPEIKLNIGFKTNTILMLIRTAAQNKKDVEAASRYGNRLCFKVDKTRAVCNICNQLSGKVRKATGFPELPYDKCASSGGACWFDWA